jgi:spore protease
MNKKYTRTDLACESPAAQNPKEATGVDYYETEQNGIKVCRLDVKDKSGEIESGKPCGSYITIFSERVWEQSEEYFDNVCLTVSSQIRRLASEMCESSTLPESVLIAGLGNRAITADAIGPKTADSVTVTRHVRREAELFAMLGGCEVSSISPGVLGQTGIETVELVRGAAENVSPDIIIVVDALAAKNCDRLCTTVQLSSTGICPGSGIGNKRKAINQSSIGIPVMSLGVPTVVESSTLVWDALERAGIDSSDEDLTRILENGKSFFVTPKETDIIIDDISRLLARSLDIAFAR